MIGHDAIDTKRCKLIYIIPTKVEHFILLVYQFENNTTTIICWNIDEDHEHSNFSSQPGDLFIDYFTDRNSKLGFASFNNYIVDMDNCIPNPFIKRTERDEERFWLQGMKANFNQDMFLNKGYLVSSICFKDIYYNKYKSLDLLDIEKVTYYMDKKSVIFDYLEEHDKLLTVLNIFEKNPIYYWMILLPNNDNKTALEFAIENNSAKVVEVLLNSLIKLGDVSLSKMIYKQFPHLFKMQLVAFASYLNTCYFTTSQMATINKLRIPEGVDSIREFTDWWILDKQFYKHFGIDEKGLKPKINAIYPADRPSSVQDIKVDENKDKFEINKNPLKRVTIKGIEFDWVFKSKEGSDFLQELSETDNIRIFEHEIIKDIVLFQWSYFKIHIILKLLIPYIVYFLIFVLHVTYIIKNEHYETSKESQPYHISAWIFGSIILIFNVFWAYVEFTQMMFHKSVYFKSFWNLLDLSSVALNTAVVIMEFSSADFANINRVSSVSVLILYFKIFYFLRIFFATGYLVRMIVQIVVDMKNFVVVLIISVMAFADSYYILGRNSDSTNFAGQDIAGAFIFSWSMGIGNANTSGFGTKDEEVLYIIYIINLIINLVMLLNLVVAIMGDTFDKVQKTQELSMLQELAQMIRENEFLFSRKRIFKKAKYILVIEPEKAEGVGLTSWEGKINQIKNFIEESTTEHMKQLKKLQSNIEDIGMSIYLFCYIKLTII